MHVVRCCPLLCVVLYLLRHHAVVSVLAAVEAEVVAACVVCSVCSRWRVHWLGFGCPGSWPPCCVRVTVHTRRRRHARCCLLPSTLRRGCRSRPVYACGSRALLDASAEQATQVPACVFVSLCL